MLFCGCCSSHEQESLVLSGAVVPTTAGCRLGRSQGTAEQAAAVSGNPWRAADDPRLHHVSQERGSAATPIYRCASVVGARRSRCRAAAGRHHHVLQPQQSRPAVEPCLWFIAVVYFFWSPVHQEGLRELSARERTCALDADCRGMNWSVAGASSRQREVSKAQRAETSNQKKTKMF